MSQYQGTLNKSFVSGATHTRGTRVTLAAGVTAAAGITANNWIGVTTRTVTTAGDAVDVQLRAVPFQGIAAAAITAGAFVYTAASGKFSVSAATGFIAGIALTAATADGDLIEIMPLSGDTAVV